MANKIKPSELTKRENFMLEGKLSELDWVPKSQEQLRTELFKGSDPEKMIDQYEKQLGITVKDVAPKNQRYKCVYLSPTSSEDDQELMIKFYNNPEQYQVISRSDNWTPQGHLKIFLEYFENIDIRMDKENVTEETN